ncbi:efflux RND transporter periplasmic adaptor subunit [Bacillus sp. V33-4]|uniref:efflux RND transporter periplasmic adaptor subunit n=1 Tax=Bacillus sp. V33-4 TaxID=2054169 RepID=UPI000C77D589|nr:efflux RND transporter periplasmic adaptor subunit [Bacillus sp. V33-4]PLR85431.1 hypothetical protein CVD23_08625 [Bacillus sp. V33-4]
MKWRINWKKTSLIAGLILFLSANLYLLFKSESEIIRAARVEKWTTVKQQNLRETMKATGKVAPFEEFHVYFNKERGNLSDILVEEGDAVESGTPLIEYSSSNTENEISNLEAEITRAEEEISRLDDHIMELESLQSDTSSYDSYDSSSSFDDSTDSFDDTSDDFDSADSYGSGNSSNEVINYSIQQEILNKELRIAELEAEIVKYEEIITALEEGLTEMTVNSELDGWVKSVRHDLGNPIVKIISNQQKVEGMLPEDKFLKLSEGMKASVTSPIVSGKREGTVEKIAGFASDNPENGQASSYPFQIHLEENFKGLVHGSNVDVTLITKEAKDALTVPAASIKRKGSVYVMAGNGKLSRQAVQPGLEVNGTKEIVKGVKQGEFIVLESTSKLRNKTPFYTPVETGKWSKKAFKQLDKKEYIKYIITGFLQM